MKIRKIFRADKNDGLGVTTATMNIQTPLAGSVYFHTETAHASQSSEKTIQDSQTVNRLLYSNRSRLGNRQEVQSWAAPVPTAELGSGIFAKHRNWVCVSLTPTCAHILSLPWLRLWWGAAPFTSLLVFFQLFLSLMETQKIPISPSFCPPSYLLCAPGIISALPTSLGWETARSSALRDTCSWIHQQTKEEMKSGECRKGREQLGRSKGKIKGQLWYHASWMLVPSQWENQIILIGGLHILCCWQFRSWPQNKASHGWLKR